MLIDHTGCFIRHLIQCRTENEFEEEVKAEPERTQCNMDVEQYPGISRKIRNDWTTQEKHGCDSCKPRTLSMQRFSKGDRVRVDIPDEKDPDHEQYHRVHGHVVTVLTDDAEAVTGDERDDRLYRVSLNTGETEKEKSRP